MDNNLLSARIDDTITICERTNRPKFFGFLSAEEAVFVDRCFKNRKISYKLFGGFDSAKRVMLGCFPEWTEDFSFPISAITFTFRKGDTLRHRDFLGTLMALGIKRETVGDILIEEGRAVVFVLQEIANFILNNVNKVGGVGVTLSDSFLEPLPETDVLTESTVTVSSNRLDCVISACVSVSRNTANEYISSGLVSINSVVCQKHTKLILQGDAITVRGKGKFIITSISGKTKKDRTILVYKKYF